MLEDVDIDNIQVSNIVSSGEKNYKYFITYKDGDDDYRIKPLNIMFPKYSCYLKSYDGEIKLMIFYGQRCWFVEKINWFGWKSVIIAKKIWLQAGLHQKLFHFVKVVYVCWLVILFLKKIKNHYTQVFFTLLRMARVKKDLPTSFSPVTSENIRISSQNFVTFIFKLFITLM